MGGGGGRRGGGGGALDELEELGLLDAGGAAVVRERGDDGAHARLRRHAGHAVDGHVDGVGARRGGRQHRGDAGRGRVVRVHVDRQVRELAAQRRDERVRGARLEQPRHVLDAEDVDVAALDELPRELEVVVERELGLRRVGDVARVRDRRLDDAARAADGVAAQLQVVEVVERVEDAEDVHPLFDGDVAELVDGVVGVVGVADGVGAAQQHLERHVGHQRAHLLEPLPRALAQEAQRDVEGGAAPVLERVAAVQRVRRRGRDREDVLGAHARREQALVRVAPRRVGEEQPLVLAHRLGKRRGAARLEHLLEARRRRRLGIILDGQQRRDARRDGAGGALHGAAVDDQLAEVVEQLLAAVLDDGKVEELRRLVGDERRRGGARDEVGVAQDVADEGDVGRDAADARLDERARHLLGGTLEVERRARHLHQHRVVVRRDRRARVGVAAVEADAEALGGAPHLQPPRVGAEVVRRVLGRDARLDRVAAHANVPLPQPAASGCRTPPRPAESVETQQPACGPLAARVAASPLRVYSEPLQYVSGHAPAHVAPGRPLEEDRWQPPRVEGPARATIVGPPLIEDSVVARRATLRSRRRGCRRRGAQAAAA